jgi:cytochrome c peroxidase
LILSACDDYTWRFPAGLPQPRVPADNPMTAAKVDLGRHLFYEKRLSVNGTTSCGTCHRQELAFTDGRPRAKGATGTLHARSSMSLVNVAYNARLTWANPLMDSLEAQALVPMFGENPVEMGLAGKEREVLAGLVADEGYARRFRAAFPTDDEPVTVANIAKAIASFERTILSGESAYDKYMRGETTALSEGARRGMELFFSERLECFHCHGGFNFMDASVHAGQQAVALPFHNTGLYNEDGRGAYPMTNTGIHEITGESADMGRFRAPTLRNVAITAPYMHDGSLATLEDVIDHYAAGGKARGPLISEFVPGFILTDQEKRDVVSFLESLTDPAVLTDPALADPHGSVPRVID